MTTLLQFKQGDSGTTLNLNSSPTGFQLEENGWNPVVATPVHMGDPPPVLERLDLLLSNTSYNNLASDMQSLHEMQVIASRYINDPTQEDPVWLHAKMDGETGERRALVRSITVQYKAPWFGAGAATTNIPLVITVVREPYWENPTAMPLPDVAPSAAACVVYDYTSGAGEDIVGDVGARIRFFELLNNNFNFVNYWMGIRSADKHGATGISNFVEIWECEDGANSTDASDSVDATASGGNRVTVSESAVDWDDGDFHDCLVLQLTDVSANEEDFIGNFLWLLRSKATSGTWEVQCTFSGIGSFPEIAKDIVEINASFWKFYEAGIMPIPLYSLQTIIDADFNKTGIKYYITITARRTSGSGDLHLDCLIPIPVDEGSCKLTVRSTGGALTEILGQSPHGQVQLIRRDSGNLFMDTSSIDSINNFVLPPGDGRVYCVYIGGAGSDITDTITFNDGNTGEYHERWLSLRGSE